MYRMSMQGLHNMKLVDRSLKDCDDAKAMEGKEVCEFVIGKQIGPYSYPSMTLLLESMNTYY